MTYIDGINATAMDKFLEALESGDYIQGTHRLHTKTSTGEEMCCLGVASNVLGPECGVTLLNPLGGEDSLESGATRLYYDLRRNQAYKLLMPPSVGRYLGIPEDHLGETMGSNSGQYILVWANDEEIQEDTFDDLYKINGRKTISVSTLNDRGVSFKTIAKRLRETFSVPQEWMPGINKEAMDKFISDLRSGEYNQARFQLFDSGSNGFCCLGVMTDGVHQEVGLTKDCDRDAYTKGVLFEEGYQSFSGVLPVSVAQHMGLPAEYLDEHLGDMTATNVYLVAHDSDEGYTLFDERHGKKMIAATALNDSRNLSFKEIADRFEETFKVDVKEEN